MARGPGQPPKGRIRTVLHLSPRARAWLERVAEVRQQSMADVVTELLESQAEAWEAMPPAGTSDGPVVI